MLQQEPQEQAASTPPAPEIPAAQIRVTSEELAQAINALEARKDEAARHLAGTVSIGEVVQELNLEATPEEVWAQVQKQRARKASEDAAVETAAAQKEQATAAQAVAAAQAAAAQAVAAARSAAQSAQAGAQVYARPRRRGRWWVPLGIGLLIYAGVHGNHVHIPATAKGAVISGNNRTLTSATQGKAVAVSGDKDTLILQGDCPTLTIAGNGNHIRVEGTVERVIAAGNGNSVVYTQGSEPTLIGMGKGNQVGPGTP